MSETAEGPEEAMCFTEDGLQANEKVDTNMFASVWVKVEVNDDEDSQGYENPLENVEVKKKTSKKGKKTLKCESCDYTTAYNNCLQLHKLSHTNSKPHSCPNCDYVTKFPTALRRHYVTQHEYKETGDNKDIPIYKCDHCSYTSHNKWNFKAHLRKHKTEKKYKCNQCTYTTAYRHNYTKHCKRHSKTEEIIHKCDKCPFVTKYEGHITRHLAKIHKEVSEKAKKCDFCDFTTKVRWRVNVHKQKSKQNDILKCNYCDFETYYMCESKKHKINHYNEIVLAKKNKLKEEKNNAEIISMEYQQFIEPSSPESDSCSLHEKKNHYRVDRVCEVDLTKIQVLKSIDQEKPFQCSMCKYSARFKASVQRHFVRHHTEKKNKPYKCLNCDFSTKTKDQISLHNKRSRSDMRMYCSSCDFSTNFKCQYALHEKIHYENKCTACSYSCKSKYDIIKHYSSVHLGNGLKCRFCDFVATRTESLICHESTHTGYKPLQCSLCDYSCVRQSRLSNHVKRYHADVNIVISEKKTQSLATNSTGQSQNDNLSDFFDESDSKDYLVQ